MIHIKSAEEYMELSKNNVVYKNDPQGKFIAQEEYVPIEIWLEVLEKYPISYVKYNILLNKKLQPEIIKLLSNDKDPEVREYVARRKDITDRELFEKLASDENEMVRNTIALHSNLPIDMLEKLSYDKSLLVRQSVAYNKNTPAEILVRLGRSDKSWIREAVAMHKNTPKEVLLKLLKDEDELVKREAEDELYEREFGPRQINEEEERKCKLARDANTSIDILTELSKDSSVLVRDTITENPNTPMEILLKLSKDQHKFVQLGANDELKRRGVNIEKLQE